MVQNAIGTVKGWYKQFSVDQQSAVKAQRVIGTVQEQCRVLSVQRGIDTNPHSVVLVEFGDGTMCQCYGVVTVHSVVMVKWGVIVAVLQQYSLTIPQCGIGMLCYNVTGMAHNCQCQLVIQQVL